jgi:hypothetical protein
VFIELINQFVDLARERFELVLFAEFDLDIPFAGQHFRNILFQTVDGARDPV